MLEISSEHEVWSSRRGPGVARFFDGSLGLANKRTTESLTRFLPEMSMFELREKKSGSAVNERDLWPFFRAMENIWRKDVSLPEVKYVFSDAPLEVLGIVNAWSEVERLMEEVWEAWGDLRRFLEERTRWRGVATQRMERGLELLKWLLGGREWDVEIRVRWLLVERGVKEEEIKAAWRAYLSGKDVGWLDRMRIAEELKGGVADIVVVD
ncbi:hypothetical protein MNV49_005995 [Pseudohyphozyma bogoriensis]|nr:hypothetical protein MNV49_005995 [Pseudohyphozyma bogoriensis]